MCEVVDEFCDLLQNHANRDKVVSLTCYVLKLWGARAQSKPLLSASARLAGARATLRLFDDAAALRVALNYGLGKQEGPLWGALGVSSGAFTLVYLQANVLLVYILSICKEGPLWSALGVSSGAFTLVYLQANVLLVYILSIYKEGPLWGALGVSSGAFLLVYLQANVLLVYILSICKEGPLWGALGVSSGAFTLVYLQAIVLLVYILSICKEGPLWSALGVSSGAFTLVYLQAEKLVWLLDTGLLTLPQHLDYRVRTAHKVFWVLMTSVGFIRSIKPLHTSAQELKSRRPRKCAPARFTQASLLCTKLLLDVVHSVSWLPGGWLWGGRLSTEHASGVATASAVLGLIAHYHGKRLAR